MKKIAFHIQKGGVGKTTLAGNVAHVSARTRRTVLVDCDPQGNASSWFLTEAPARELADVLRGTVRAEEALVPLSDRLAILPTFGLDGGLKAYAESALNDEPYVFEDLCAELGRLGYEVAVFDLSPGMSRLEKCVLLAMDEVVTPMTPEYFSVDGIEIFKNELGKVNRNYRREVKHTKVVLNALNKGYRRHRHFYEQFAGGTAFEMFYVPQDARIAEAQLYNRSLFDFDPEAKAIPELERLTAAVVGG